ncbi:hypothetical protein [Egicoccus sp. AB-alg6-2]|uniref:hypothetical protein n=1 Tax=Egicoccus sp. AB-alg6-2 TaxID=3242692 RepID=UPI00359EF0AB
MSRQRTLVRGGAAALVATALVAAPALAHPFVRGGELPVDSLATMTLAMAHGCGGHEGDEIPTLEVALEVPDWLRIVEVAPTDGYEVEFEETTAGATSVVVWTADGAGVPAPTFDLDVVASGEEGDQRHLAVFQGCEGASYRWVGTPDEPADDPAVSVTLTAADPAAPPPPEAPAADLDGGSDGDPDAAPDAAPETDPDARAEPDATTDDAEDAADADAPDDATTGEGEVTDNDDGTAAAGDDADRSLLPVIVAVAAVLLLAGAALLLARRRRMNGDAP